MAIGAFAEYPRKRDEICHHFQHRHQECARWQTADRYFAFFYDYLQKFAEPFTLPDSGLTSIQTAIETAGAPLTGSYSAAGSACDYAEPEQRSVMGTMRIWKGTREQSDIMNQISAAAFACFVGFTAHDYT